MVSRLRIGLALAICTGVGAPCLAQEGSTTLLVTPQQLARELNDPNLVLLQVGPKDNYEAGHIPGARLLQM
jgi:thiosulfate/3-mercaptopyruvate sulfurtransferase